MYQQIIQSAKEQQKNILVMGSPRSGTHAVGAELAILTNAVCLGEICKMSDNPTPWEEIQSLYNTNTLTIAQIVQLTPKIYLSHNVDIIKKHTVIVNVCRRNKIKQFASWVYFRLLDPTELGSWHNHKGAKTNVLQHSIVATEEDLVQFVLEQLVDFYFLPDFNLCYEDLIFTQQQYQKNEFAFPIELMFSNLEYVEQYLKNWQYSLGHLSNDK